MNSRERSATIAVSACRRSTQNGTKVGGEILVNSQTAGNQYENDVTALSDGGFLVTWTDQNKAGDIGFGASIDAQRFDASGAKVGDQFEIAVVSGAVSDVPIVKGLANGGFVVSWSAAYYSPNDGYIEAQLYDATGAKAGGQFRVDNGGYAGRYGLAVTALSNGDFIESWQDYGPVPGAFGYGAIVAQLFDADGAKLGDQFLVSSQAMHFELHPALAQLANGQVVMTWDDNNDIHGFEAGDIKAQRFDINLSSVNFPPKLSAPQAVLPHATEDLPYTVSAANLLTGFSDANGDTLSITNIGSSIGVVHDNHDGTFTVSATPSFANFNGPATLSYTVGDGHGGTLAATIGYVVDPVNDAPTVVGKEAVTDVATPVTFDLATLLAGSNDVDGDTLSLAGFGAATHGSVTTGAGGGLVYTPDAGFVGGDGFTFTLTDGHGGEGSATVHVTIGTGPTYDFSGSTTGQTFAVGNGVLNATIIGSGHADSLTGGAGNDVIVGGGGGDTLTGGAGSDTFRFESRADSPAGFGLRDVIKDFVVGEDVLDLTAILATPVTVVDHFSHVAGEVRENVYNSGWVTLSVDTDGNASADMQILVHTGGAPLSAADFVL